MATAQKKSADVLADFKVTPARKVQYESTLSTSAPLTLDANYPGGASVHRGKRVRDGLPMFYVQDGTSQPFGLPLSAVSAIIAGGLVSAEEVTELLK